MTALSVEISTSGERGGQLFQIPNNGVGAATGCQGVNGAHVREQARRPRRIASEIAENRLVEREAHGGLDHAGENGDRIRDGILRKFRP